MDGPAPRAQVNSRAVFEASVAGALRGGIAGTRSCAVVVVALHPSWVAANWLDAQVRNACRDAVEQRLESLLLDGDALAALDGGEWVLLLMNVSTADQGAAVAERIAEAVSHPVDLGEESPSPVVCTGVAVATGMHRRPSDLIDEARSALLIAIERGGGQLVLFDEQLRLDILHRFRISQSVGRGFEMAQLQLWYQPIVSIVDGSIVAAEALLRWPGGAWMEGASHIVSLAERSEVVGRLGDWVIETACAHAQRWAHAGIVTHINMSPRQLAQSDLAAKMVTTVERFGLDPAHISIEITESSAMPQAAIDSIREMSKAGFGICIDDFGTGYANLAALRTLPVDMVKLDRTVVSGIRRGSSAVAMVEAVVGMGRALDMQVTAEGIETPDELATIRATGCDLAQGYLLDRPMTAEALEDAYVSSLARRFA